MSGYNVTAEKQAEPLIDEGDATARIKELMDSPRAAEDPAIRALARHADFLTAESMTRMLDTLELTIELRACVRRMYALQRTVDQQNAKITRLERASALHARALCKQKGLIIAEHDEICTLFGELGELQRGRPHIKPAA